MTPDQLLAFEAQYPHQTPDKTSRIRHQLGISEVRYYVLLGRTARTVTGIKADPVTARLVRERADGRAQARLSRFA